MYNRFGLWQSSISNPALESDIPHGGEFASGLALRDASKALTCISIPLEMIPTDLPLPCALYVRIYDKFVLFRKAGDTLTAARALALSVPSNGIIYVSLTEWNLLLHSLESIAIAGKAAQESPSVEAKALHVRNLLIGYAYEIQQKRSFTPELFARISQLGDELAKLVHEKPSVSATILRRYQDPALYHINHVVNVAVYSIEVGKKQNLDLPAMKLLATAALVHNIGNTMIPAELLFKAGELTVEEKDTVDSHILHGAALLQDLRASKESILTAIQHHDRFDGKGTAGRAAGQEIHLFARICSIADVFDAITSMRPYHMRPLKPGAAIRRMSEMQGKFDPQILPMVGSDKEAR